jgi:hypothetical protein
MSTQEIENKKESILQLLELHKKVYNRLLSYKEFVLYVKLINELLKSINNDLNFRKDLSEILEVVSDNEILLEDSLYKVFTSPSALKSKKDKEIEKAVLNYLNRKTFAIQYNFVNSIKKMKWDSRPELKILGKLHKQSHTTLSMKFTYGESLEVIAFCDEMLYIDKVSIENFPPNYSGEITIDFNKKNLKYTIPITENETSIDLIKKFANNHSDYVSYDINSILVKLNPNDKLKPNHSQENIIISIDQITGEESGDGFF